MPTPGEDFTNTMTRSYIVQTIAVLCCVGAAYISHNLLMKHLNGTSGVAWFESGCKESNGSGSSADCDAVLASPYAYWPPKLNPDSRKPHIPVAFLGLLYFSMLGIWLFGVGSPSIDRRWIHIVPLGMVVMGLLSSANFLNIMFSKLDQWCPWCLVTHILNVIIAISVFLLFPKDHAKDDTPKPEDDAKPATPATARHPSTRLAWTTILAMLLFFYGANQMHGQQNASKAALANKSNFNRCVQAIQRIQKSGRALLVDWEDAPKFDIDIRPDDPIRQPNPQPGAWDVVVFSDFECPSCQRFASFIERKVQPLFDERLRIIFKHYPLDPKCNGRVRYPKHPHACNAARIAEGARLLGGNDGFWKAHDYLFRNRDNIRAGIMTPEVVAEAAGLDPQALKDAMSSADIQTRFDGDTTQAKKCELKGTPGVYVNGKHVDTLATMQVSFWDKLSDRYWQERQEPRPPHTRLKKSSVTPGTPVPVGDP